MVAVWLLSAGGTVRVLAVPAGAGELPGLPAAALTILHDGITQLYNLELDRADASFTRVAALASNHPAPYVYLAASLVTRSMCEGLSQEHNQGIARCLQRAVEAAGAQTNTVSRAWQDVYIGAVFLVQAQQVGLRGDYLDGLYALKRAAARLERAARDPAVAVDAGVLLGAYQYFGDYTPWYMRQFAGLLLSPTSRAAGLRRLDDGTTQAVLLQPEARMLACVAHTWERNDERAEELAAGLTNQFPNNPQWDLLLQYVLLQSGKYEAALASATNALARLETTARPLARAVLPDQHYYCGVIYAAGTNYHRALTHFGAAAAFAGRKARLRMWAVLRQGTMHDLLGERDAARACYRAAHTGRDAPQSVRAYARQFLDQPYAGQTLE